MHFSHLLSFYLSTLCAYCVAHRDSGGQVTLAIFRCRKITIVAVNGHAAGVGVTGLQLPCDFRFIWARAKLALPFVRRGIAPEGVLQSFRMAQMSDKNTWS